LDGDVPATHEELPKKAVPLKPAAVKASTFTAIVGVADQQ